MLAIILPFRIKADVIYDTSLQDQGRCYLSYCPSGSRPMLVFMTSAVILKGSMIANIGLDPEGKHDS
jgi:protein tyrosine phosphatase (PTP) superfamily phosphohydrolase (DUF442 family)